MAEPGQEQRGALQWCCSSWGVLWEVSSCPCPPATLFLPAAVRMEMPPPCEASPSFYLPPFLTNLPFFKLTVLIPGFNFLTFFLSSFQLSIPWIPHALSGSLTLLWHPISFSQPILSLPLPCSSSGTTPLLPNFLSLSPRLFPSQFYQLYPSCIPKIPNFSLATAHAQGQSQGCH